MKKMFFTAIAVVAFMGSSMANTKEVTHAKTRTAKVVLFRSRCDAIWLLSFLNHGGSGNYDSAVWYADLETAAAGGCSGAW